MAHQSSPSSNDLPTDNATDTVIETMSSSSIDNSPTVVAADQPADAVMKTVSSPAAGTSSNVVPADNPSETVIEITSSPSTDNASNTATADNLANAVISVMSSPSDDNSSDIVITDNTAHAAIEIMSSSSVDSSSNVAAASHASDAVIEIMSSPSADALSDTTPSPTSFRRLPLALVGIGPNADANARRPGYPAFARVNKESLQAFLHAYIRIDKNPNDPIVYDPAVLRPEEMCDLFFTEAVQLIPHVDCVYINPRTDEISLGCKTDIPDPAFAPGYVSPDLGYDINIQIKMARIVIEDFSAWTDYEYPIQQFIALDEEPVATIKLDELKYPNVDQITAIFRGVEDEWKSGCNSYVVNYNVDTDRVFVDYDSKDGAELARETLRIEYRKLKESHQTTADPELAESEDESDGKSDGKSDDTSSDEVAPKEPEYVDDEGVLTVRIIFHRNTDKDHGPYLLKPFDPDEIFDPEDLEDGGRMERVFWEIAATAVNERLAL
ncbi:hypothetical protein CSAL01_09820 [Colletotrichum salicis]|uniref:Uncharacterized protein n=1 Tax=Colletotrichum salicis TaxID=1209931 RepID=A0A135TY68_9PEZI|nr:hypothetical protein CSAL01_09820 [Colletotrichum salicis]